MRFLKKCNRKRVFLKIWYFEKKWNTVKKTVDRNYNESSQQAFELFSSVDEIIDIVMFLSSYLSYYR